MLAVSMKQIHNSNGATRMTTSGIKASIVSLKRPSALASGQRDLTLFDKAGAVALMLCPCLYAGMPQRSIGDVRDGCSWRTLLMTPSVLRQMGSLSRVS